MKIKYFPAIIFGSALVGQVQLPCAAALSIRPDPAIAPYAVPANREQILSASQEVALLRRKVKYVFVIYQENRSFDSYFGTFPGADGLFSQPIAKTPGFYQKIDDVDGSYSMLHPFRLDPGPPYYAADLGDCNHSHAATLSKMNIAAGAPQMDKFAITEEQNRSGGVLSLRAKQYGELEMAYEDGAMIPFLWRYANRFVLFDHIFEDMAGPSTPGNLSIIGAQSGQTQWMLHPNEAYKGNGGSGPGVPVMNDSDPLWGSPADNTTLADKMPINPHDFHNPKKKPQINLSYATLPVTLSGKKLNLITQTDRDKTIDLSDIHEDIPFVTNEGKAVIPWGWYQEGFDQEKAIPKIPAGDPLYAGGLHASYVTHHNGPQYFGYIANNPQMSDHLHGLYDFFRTIANRGLPKTGGLFYIKGGHQNILGLTPADPDPLVQRDFQGDDDHPGGSDAQISEAAVATAVNAIAASPYWMHCAIIIAWDDSDGQYDHVPPTIHGFGPDGTVISDGPRIPLLLISPYAKIHAVAHSVGDQASVVKFADLLYNLTPLAELPDELKAREIGERKGLKDEGPFDALTPDVSNLLSGFDPARLLGRAAPLPGSYAMIPQSIVLSIPPMITARDGKKLPFGLAQIGVLPTDYRLGIVNDIPSDFNPRPNGHPVTMSK